MKIRLTHLGLRFAMAVTLTVSAFAQEKVAPADSHGWIGTETVKTRFGDFEFKNGYPTPTAADALLDQLKFNRAIEVYLTQMPVVSLAAEHRGLAAFGVGSFNEVIMWESLLDAETLMLTPNPETVYALGHMDLKSTGPIVMEAPPKMLGFAMDVRQRYLVDIGPLGPDKGKGGKYLFLPPGYTGEVPDGYFVTKSPTYELGFGLRGFQVDGKTDQAVSLMKQIKIYPLAKKDNPPAMKFVNGSGKPIVMIHPDNFEYFEMLALIVAEEPAEIFTPLERFQMQAIGIEKGKPFNPNAKTKAMLGEAARTGGAFARANAFASPVPDTYFYPDRKWQYFGEMPYNFMRDGVVDVDRRAYVHYMGIGNSPAMVVKNIGAGSYYLWAYKDSAGEFLDGAKSYKLHIPPKVPVKDFWSVVVYDSQSRAELKNGQKFPAVSLYTGPKVNADGSADVYFGPEIPPGQEKNWIKTVPGKGWFPFFRFYGPLEPLYEKTWKLSDIELVK